MPKSDQQRVWARAILIVGAITLIRVVLLRFNRTDLFVDESQYWLWGQDFAFGYYSKPPLIAWVIGAVTGLTGNNGAFYVRLPGPVFHGAAALILAMLADRLHGPRVAFWVAVSYVTLPMVAVGSLLISTDTIMAPFFAAALLFHARLVESRAARFALLAGAAAGLAFLAKYAAVYFLLGAGLGALIFPAMRIGWRNAGLMGLAFGIVIAPNMVWNLGHSFATLSHTMDNVGWVRGGGPDPAGMFSFLAAQFAVFGPVLFAALIWAAIRPRSGGAWRLLMFSVPAIAIVTVQASLGRAYANWAASAYFAGIIVAVAALRDRPRLLMLSLAVNGAITVALPVLTLWPHLTFGRDEPVMARYLGRSYLSRQILAAAEVAGDLPVVADRRDIIADLFHTGAGSGVAIFARPRAGRPQNHYEQVRALPEGVTGTVLYVTDVPPVCGGAAVPVHEQLDTDGGTYQGEAIAAYLVPAECLHVPR